MVVNVISLISNDLDQISISYSILDLLLEILGK